MAKPERALNLALAQLRRPAWPAEPPTFENASPIASGPDLLTCDEAIRLGLVAAQRMTCNVSADRVARFLQAPTPRHVLIHAIDAEPGTPLLIHWLLHHVETVEAMATQLARDFAAEVLFALPADLPDRLRKPLRRLSPIVWIDARYPGGHWRLLPRGARLRSATLTLDAVAVTDLREATITGNAPAMRPVAIPSGGIDSTPLYCCVERGMAIHSLTVTDDELDWYAGPRLADRVVDPGDRIGDGELTFHREIRHGRVSAPCIRCGACVEVCPTRCDPLALLRAHDAAVLPSPRRLRREGLDACVDCGLCTASCPPGIELHHAIARLRARVVPEAT